MNVSETAKKLNISEDELRDFSDKNGIDLNYTPEGYAIYLYRQAHSEAGERAATAPKEVGERPTVAPVEAGERPAAAPEVETVKTEPLKDEDVRIELLRKIAENTEKAAFWIRFWSILSIVSAIIVIFALLINVF